jgi:hypothetical protein
MSRSISKMASSAQTKIVRKPLPNRFPCSQTLGGGCKKRMIQLEL